MVIQISPFDNMKINSEIENFNMLFNLDNTRDIFFIRGTSLVFIKSLKKKELKEQSSIIEKIARVILDRFESIFNSVAIGIGQTIQELDKLYLSYEGAKHALKVGEKLLYYLPIIYIYITNKYKRGIKSQHFFSVDFCAFCIYLLQYDIYFPDIIYIE